MFFRLTEPSTTPHWKETTERALSLSVSESQRLPPLSHHPHWTNYPQSSYRYRPARPPSPRKVYPKMLPVPEGREDRRHLMGVLVKPNKLAEKPKFTYKAIGL